MVNNSKSEEQIYYAALEKPPDERSAYVKAACGDNLELLEQVESLLKIRENQNNFLESPLFIDPPQLITLPQEQPGSIIGRYKILEKIGEGGMAVVYMAEQEKPIHRKVALKIIKLGMDTKQVIARFEAERQALAMMDHPNIAKVFDAGATDTGRPYFVMELVTGVSITEYCDKNNLSTKERLSLFIQVCNAIQHAHQKGIIHRDIKPTNVMVTQRDGEPFPKVIDFGIAKATRQRLTEKTLFTRYAHIIGTPTYMSPEQADLSDLDVDTRSDIYSLGVLLYELLTGTTPFSDEELRKAGYLEMQRMIREKEPAKPSTRLTTLGQTLIDIAKHRGCTPDLLTKTVRGDLDWISMKALEKARDRRYDNASALALDVQRHLNYEPISVRAPSELYRLGKFLRRHRSQALAMLMMLVLFLAIVTILLLLNQSRLQSSRVESKDHIQKLYQATMSLNKGDYASAIESVRSILDSRHFGNEAQFMYNHILNTTNEQITYYSSRIEANPKDAKSYLHRAQCHYYLQDKENFLADMDNYVAILNPSAEMKSGNSWFRDLLVGLWGNRPTNLGSTVNSPSCELGPCLSPDGLELYFYSHRSGGVGSNKKWMLSALDLWVATRETTTDNWSTPENPGSTINTTGPDGSACLSADGLTLIFDSGRPEGNGGVDLWMTTRANVSDSWDMPKNLGPAVNSSAADIGASITADGLSLYFGSDRPGGSGFWDIYVTTRVTISAPWEEAENLGPTINSVGFDGHPYITPDGLVLIFCSDRPGGFGDWDIWVTMRATSDDDWGAPMNLGPIVNTTFGEAEPFLSSDGRVLYFSDWRLPRPGGEGNNDLWQISIHPKPDSFQQNSNIESVQEPVTNIDRKGVIK
jgi:serine/threonine protein kinase/Tol biopolymer transport system component